MSPPDGQRRRPRQETPSTIAETSLNPVNVPLDELAQHVDGAFVVVVEATGGKYRRRCFLTAAAAERSAGKALAKGYNAKVCLAELKPLWRLEGGERHG